MSPRWAVLPLLAYASAAQAGFHPPEGQVFRYVTSETRVDGTISRMFRTERHVVFQREGDGFLADVTLDAVSQTAGGDIGAMFDHSTGALKGRTLRFHLDSNGTVTAIDDSDTAIDLIATAIETMAHGDHGNVAARQAHAKQLASPLRSLPPAAKQAILGSIVAPLIAGMLADRTPGTRKASVPVDPAFGAGGVLPGEESVSRGADGIVFQRITAHGDGARIASGAPGADLIAPGGHDATIDVTITRRADPTTGLILESIERSETRPAGRAATSVSTTVQLIPAT